MVAAVYGGLAAMQIAGGYFAAENMKQAAILNQDIAEMNAEFAELDAHDAELDGLSEVARYQGIVDQTLSEQTTALTAADVDLSFGSASTIETETRFLAEMNRMEIENDAEAKALGYTREARDRRLGGFLQRADSAGREFGAKFQGITGAAQTGLTGYSRRSN